MPAIRQAPALQLIWPELVKDTWYADQRDLVKWGTLTHLAALHSLETIVQVAYLRFGKRPPLVHGSEGVPIPDVVWNFFRDVTAVQRLGDSLARRVVVIDREFLPRQRRQYRQAVVTTIREIAGSKVVLLDPDTGIAPSRPSGKHVSTDDITAVWAVLSPGDWLAVYQHRSRRKTWMNEARDRLAALCGTEVHVYAGPDVASDVVFLAARRPGEET